MATDPLDLPADALADRLATGAVRATEVAAAVSARIAARNDAVRALCWHDADHLALEAERREIARKAGRGIGRLHGLPVALKDIIDTAGIPTENGTEVDRGRVPKADAWIVRRLKAEGALIAGKAVTTELAFMTPSETRNPRDPSRSPGGSSSGSAAAVAAGIVPFAIGTQTNGSVIRPAAYCGVTGYKPSFGAIPRTGILPQSPSLDTVGVFAATPHAAAMLAETLFGDDPADPATAPRPRPALAAATARGPAAAPTFAILHPPGWAEAEDQVRAALDELRDALGERAFETALPDLFAEAQPQRDCVNLAEMARCYRRYADRPDLISPATILALERGARITARDYLAALDWRPVLSAGLSEILRRADAILCPAAPGPAPAMGSTGDPVFNGLWTFTGLPAVSIPLFTSDEGWPMGLQVIAGPGDDARCLAAAQWLYDWAASEGETQ